MACSLIVPDTIVVTATPGLVSGTPTPVVTVLVVTATPAEKNSRFDEMVGILEGLGFKDSSKDFPDCDYTRCGLEIHPTGLGVILLDDNGAVTVVFYLHKDKEKSEPLMIDKLTLAVVTDELFPSSSQLIWKLYRYTDDKTPLGTFTADGAYYVVSYLVEKGDLYCLEVHEIVHVTN